MSTKAIEGWYHTTYSSYPRNQLQSVHWFNQAELCCQCALKLQHLGVSLCPWPPGPDWEHMLLSLLCYLLILAPGQWCCMGAWGGFPRHFRDLGAETFHLVTDTLYFWKSSINILLLQKLISLSSPGTLISISSFSFCLPTVGFGLQELVNSILFLIREAVYPIWVLWTLQSKRAPKCANSGGAGPRVPGCELSCAVQGNLARSWTWALNLFR